MADVVTWSPRVGDTGDDRYTWPENTAIQAGEQFDNTVEPDPVTVNTLTGLNQILYEINRRLLWLDTDQDGVELGREWLVGAVVPDNWRYFKFFDPIDEDDHQFETWATSDPADENYVLAKDAKPIDFTLINAMKMAIFYIEGLEGRAHFDFTFPVKDTSSPYEDLDPDDFEVYDPDRPTFTNDGRIGLELSEMRKALATDHICIFPEKIFMVTSPGSSNPRTYHNKSETGTTNPVGGFPGTIDDDALYDDLFICPANAVIGSLPDALGVVRNYVHTYYRSLSAADINRRLSRVVRAFRMPPQLPTIVSAQLRLYYGRYEAGGERTNVTGPPSSLLREGTFRSSAINIRLQDAFDNTSNACPDLWPGAVSDAETIGSHSPTATPSDDSASWIDATLDESKLPAVGTNFILYYEFSETTDQNKIAYPSLPNLNSYSSRFETAYYQVSEVNDFFVESGRQVERIKLYV